MTDRAIIGLTPAVAGGFIAGLIVATLQLDDGTATTLGVVVGLAVLLVGAVSVVRAGGTTDEKLVVGLLRAAGAAALFACLYLFMLAFLRRGDFGWAAIWAALGLALAIPLSQVRVRRRREPTDEPATGTEDRAAAG